MFFKSCFQRAINRERFLKNIVLDKKYLIKRENMLPGIFDGLTIK